MNEIQKNTVVYNVFKELCELKWFYDGIINDCISYICYKKNITLLEQEKNEIYKDVKKAYENLKVYEKL
jgi:hypothetical protein